MNRKIKELKETLGLNASIEHEIRCHRHLFPSHAEIGESLESWAQQHLQLSPDTPRLFTHDFLQQLVSGQYDKTFYRSLYRQAVHWYRLNISESGVHLLISHAGRQLQTDDMPSSLNSALRLALHLSLSLTLDIYHLNRNMHNAQQKSECELNHIKSMFSLLDASLPQALIQAYSDHQKWKSATISLALGNLSCTQDKSASIPHCPAHQLIRDGYLLLDGNGRNSLLAAHCRARQLVAKIVHGALLQPSEDTVQTLHEFEQACDTVSRVLLEHINRTLTEVTILDPLTKLRNRNTLASFFQNKLALAQHLELNLGVALIDIDHFKYINDTHGHSTGDQILQELSLFLNQQIRSDDALFRWGGEEFMIICTALPNASDDIRQMAERLRHMTEQHTFNATETPIRLTISIGVVECPNESCHHMATTFEKADQLLYQAKRNGRNQVQYGLP